MSGPRRPMIFVLAGILVLSGCACKKQKSMDAIPDTWARSQQECPAGIDRAALAGSWLYEEQGYIYTLHLDKHGNGAYEWREGQFITSCLDKQVWRGKWVQAEHDREGGFEIGLSKDLTTGEGRWWYNRIGKDSGQPRQGGQFQIKRIGGAGQLSELPHVGGDPLAADKAGDR